MNEVIGNNLTSIFSTDLTAVQIKRPLLKPTANAGFRVTKMEIVAAKDKQSKNLEITLVTSEPLDATDGEQVQPGYKHIERIALRLQDKSGGDRTDSILRDLKRFRLACGFPDGAFGDLQQYLGAELRARVEIEEDETGKYDPQNRLSFILPK